MTFLVDSRPMLVGFMASYCGHCRALQPEWSKLEQVCKGSAIRVRQIDCASNRGVCRQAGVSSFPTIRLYKNSSYKTYAGQRTAEAILAWATAG